MVQMKINCCAQGSPLRHALQALTLLLCSFASASHAHHINGLSIAGEYQPSIVGTLPVTTDYSWFWMEFVGGARFSWFYGPGTDGGIIFGQPQSHPPYDDGAGGGIVNGQAAELSDVTVFLSEYAVFFSRNNGIEIDAGHAIDMSNLSIFRGMEEIDIGSGVGGNAFVPLGPDILALQARQSGWQINGDGSYQLIFHTTYLGQPMAVYMTGNIVYSPPVITGIWPGTAAEGESSSVFVFGSNFVPGQTSVHMNGIQQFTVAVVSPEMLIMRVNVSTALYGPVTVTTPNGTAVSDTSFGLPPGGLQITGVWPGTLEAGVTTSVFVFGSEFDPAPGATEVYFNGVRQLIVQVVTPDMLIVRTTPTTALSGPVTVTTPAGSTTHSTHLVVVP